MPDAVPHIVQYQGSKRKLAPFILSFMPQRFYRLVEPFAGMAAISISCAYHRRALFFWLNDKNAPLMSILEQAISQPDLLLQQYQMLWEQQYQAPDGHLAHFYQVREQFNAGDTTAAKMLYLLARCVKGAVRYGHNGHFNQSPDKRRHGTHPTTLAQNVRAISGLLKGRTIFSALDYRQVLAQTEPGDVVYMDPPYQGVCDTRDNRYISGIRFEEFVAALHALNKRKIDFIVSYDGSYGDKSYGQDLPAELKCRKFLVHAGTSAQSILLGKPQHTIEALYVSAGLLQQLPHRYSQPSFLEAIP